MLNSPKIHLAPIQGMTNDLFCGLYQKCFTGIDLFFAPFVKIHQSPNPKSNPKTNRFSAFDPSQPLVPQILSNEAEEFPVFDRMLFPLGYPEFNWNLGCPVPMVTRKKRGSGLLPYKERIQGILDQIMPKLRCRLSIKTRLGYTHADELLALIPVFNQYPLKELIIHPRLGTQLYQGQVDLPAFAKCLSLSQHPVVYNGDIFNTRIFSSLQNQFPRVSGWMLGRGVLANPFLPAQIKGLPMPEDKLAALKHFHDEYMAAYARILSGPGHLLDKLKEFWSYLHFLFADTRSFYRQVLKIKRMDAYQILVQQFFAQQPLVLSQLETMSEDFD